MNPIFQKLHHLFQTNFQLFITDKEAVALYTTCKDLYKPSTYLIKRYFKIGDATHPIFTIPNVVLYDTHEEYFLVKEKKKNKTLQVIKRILVNTILHPSILELLPKTITSLFLQDDEALHLEINQQFQQLTHFTYKQYTRCLSQTKINSMILTLHRFIHNLPSTVTHLTIECGVYLEAINKLPISLEYLHIKMNSYEIYTRYSFTFKFKW